MAEPARLIALEAARALDGIAVPDVLEQTLDRHHQSIAGLAASLLDAGVPRAAVERAVGQAVASFKDELVTTVLALKEQGDAV